MDPRIRILLKIIDEHGGTLRMSSQQISALLGIGEARLMRLFNREVGKTFRQHLLDVRMARAAQLLENLVPPIKAVASDCGYTEVSNFCRDFKRVHGMSPQQMRFRHMDVQLPHGQSPSTKWPNLNSPPASPTDVDLTGTTAFGSNL
jgi:AraC-like DNA-binding protein